MHFNKTQDAIRSFQTAIDLAVYDATAYYNLALLYFREGNLVSAQEMARKAIERDPLLPQLQDLVKKIEKKMTKSETFNE